MSYSIKLTAHRNGNLGLVDKLEVYNTKTGDKIESIQSIKLEFGVESNPSVTIKFWPDNVDIEVLDLTIEKPVLSPYTIIEEGKPINLNEVKNES